MTTDRRKAILFLVITFILGILIGSLLPAFYGKVRHRGGEGHDRKAMHGQRDHREGARKSKGDWITFVIIRVTKPDSAQIKEIRPITAQAAAQLRELEESSNGKMSVIMDSMKLKLKPILTEEQNQLLEDFSKKARQRWKRDDKRGD